MKWWGPAAAGRWMLAIGAAVAAALYRRGCAVVTVGPEAYAELATAQSAVIAEDGTITAALP